VLPALVAAAALIAVGSALGASTRIGPHGTTLLDERKVFPIVLAKGPPRGGVTPTGGDAVDEVVGAGVNVLKVGPAATAWSAADLDDALAWNEEAAARGAYTWINLATLSKAAPGDAKAQRLREVVTALSRDEHADAIALWKGADEPFWAKTPADQLRHAYCLGTSRGGEGWCAGQTPLDSEHLWVTIQAPKGEAADLAPYTAVTDIHGVDHYPVTYGNPDPKLHEIGTWTSTIASVTPSRAVWTTLQVCASGSDNPDGDFVLPTREQERYMIYDAILNGARSLAFYGGNIHRCWDERDAALGWNWTFWDGVLEDLVRELNALSPIAPALVNPETTQVLPTSDPSTQAISRVGATEDDLWVIAARHGDGTAPVTISGLPDWAATGSVYTEGRAVAASGGSLSDDFGRWAVHVYHFRKEPPQPPAAPPPPPAPPPAPPPEPGALPAPATTAARHVLVGRGIRAASAARAGRLFTVRFRVHTLTGPLQRGSVRCAARVGRTSLRTSGKRFAPGVASCTWRLPRSARGKLVRASVHVSSRGLALTRTLAKRVRR
jgi:hypothetical protein